MSIREESAISGSVITSFEMKIETDRDITSAHINVNEATAKLHRLLAEKRREQQRREDDLHGFLTAAHGRAYLNRQWIPWLRAMGHPADDNWPDAMTLDDTETMAERLGGDWHKAARLLREHLAEQDD